VLTAHLTCDILHLPRPLLQEYEDYLSQIEAEQLGGGQMAGGAPPGAIMKPIPWLCVKAKTHKDEKVFVNVCHSPYVRHMYSACMLDVMVFCSIVGIAFLRGLIE